MPARRWPTYPFIVREPASGTRTAMEEFFDRAPPRAAHRDGDVEQRDHQAGGDGRHGLSFLSLHTIGLELRSGLLHLLDVEGTPVMRAWNVVHLASKVLSPAAEAFRYFILEHGEAYLLAHDAPLLSPPGKRKPARARKARG